VRLFVTLSGDGAEGDGAAFDPSSEDTQRFDFGFLKREGSPPIPVPPSLYRILGGRWIYLGESDDTLREVTPGTAAKHFAGHPSYWEWPPGFKGVRSGEPLPAKLTVGPPAALLEDLGRADPTQPTRDRNRPALPASGLLGQISPRNEPTGPAAPGTEADREPEQEAPAGVPEEPPSRPAAPGAVTPPGRQPANEAPSELPDLVTLDQAAALVNRSVRTLERYKKRGLPKPLVRGGGGRPHEYSLPEMRSWLETTFDRPIPVTAIPKFRHPKVADRH